jgi:hypothetical protein
MRLLERGCAPRTALEILSIEACLHRAFGSVEFISHAAQAMIAQFVTDIESFDEQWEQNPTHVNDKYQVRNLPPLCFILVQKTHSC